MFLTFQAFASDNYKNFTLLKHSNSYDNATVGNTYILVYFSFSNQGGWDNPSVKTDGLTDVVRLSYGQIGHSPYGQHYIISGKATSETISMTYNGTHNWLAGYDYFIFGMPNVTTE